MTCRARRTSLVCSARGFTIVEMMIATIVMMLVTGAIFQLLNPAQGTFQAQPEVADMQQRMRVGVDTLTKDLIMAGAGSYIGTTAGALVNYFAPVMPYRTGVNDSDPARNMFFRDDAITLVYVPTTPAQTTVRDTMRKGRDNLNVNAEANCLPGIGNRLCGFKPDMRILIFDTWGAWEPQTITTVAPLTTRIGLARLLSADYVIPSYVSEVATHTYYLKTNDERNTYQLMHYDGYQTDLPVVDNVVKLQFEYFGDPLPPQRLLNRPLAGPGPWTTYGPKPPALGAPDNPDDPWGAGENCVFSVVDGQHVPRLQTIAAGVGQVKLEPAILQDGPWCPNEGYADRYDADLLRVRRVRVTLRVQAASTALRGPAGPLFAHGGTSTSRERFVPDQEIRFDVSPRNLNLGR